MASIRCPRCGKSVASLKSVSLPRTHTCPHGEDCVCVWSGKARGDVVYCRRCRAPEGVVVRWNVRTYEVPSGRWVGCVDGRDEKDARHVAISQLNISPGVRFAVSPR